MFGTRFHRSPTIKTRKLDIAISLSYRDNPHLFSSQPNFDILTHGTLYIFIFLICGRVAVYDPVSAV